MAGFLNRYQTKIKKTKLYLSDNLHSLGRDLYNDRTQTLTQPVYSERNNVFTMIYYYTAHYYSIHII